MAGKNKGIGAEICIDAVRAVINRFELPFTSHQFIQKFAQHNERDYLGFLARYQRERGVRAVNSQIGRFLSIKCEDLGIRKDGKKNDPNFFGNKTGNELWVRV